MTKANQEMEIDDGKCVLNDLVAAHRNLILSDANEAKTRMMVIDWILRKVLGWKDDDIEPEERCSEDRTTTFADYLLKTATTFIIVEAKKAGAAFTLPSRVTSGKLGGVLSGGEIGAAIRQARDYCRVRSAQFAVVTNGSCWIVFPAIRTDGITFEETQARIFKSLEDIQDRFVEFWELLSRQRVIEGNLENELLSPNHVETAPRPLSLLREPQFKLNRNSLYQHIETAVSKAFTDDGFADDPEALNQCYVKTSERLKYDSRLKISLADTKPPLGHTTVRIRSKKSRRHLDDKIASTPASPAPKFFLILGPVGAGKSFFLKYTRRVSAAGDIEGKLLWMQVDFKGATKTDEPRQFIYDALLKLIDEDTSFRLGDWETSIEPAYADQIAALARGPLFTLKRSDPKEFDKVVGEEIMNERRSVMPYVERIVRHALTSRPGYLVVDNVDQIEDEARQNEIFSETVAAAHRMGLNVIMSLRDSTYIKNRNSPTFDAFQFESIYIDPPSIVPVLSRRFQYAKILLGKKPAEFTLANGIHFRVDDVSVFFDIAASSILSEDGAFMFDVLSGGDIRRGLSLAREFLASGHTTADIALHSYLTERKYQFAPHEIFKGAVLGNRKFFREEDAWLPNLLAAKLGTSGFQLLRLHIVYFFVTSAQSASFEGVSGDELAVTLHKVGVPQEDVSKVLAILYEHRVLRTADGTPFSTSVRLLPTRLAAFLLNELVCRFNYVEMCTLDANIYDDATWRAIVEATKHIQSSHDSLVTITPRIQRVQAFMNYLISVEERWVVECKRRHLDHLWTTQVLKTTIMPALELSLKQVQASADRMKVKREGFKGSAGAH